MEVEMNRASEYSPFCGQPFHCCSKNGQFADIGLIAPSASTQTPRTRHIIATTHTHIPNLSVKVKAMIQTCSFFLPHVCFFSEPVFSLFSTIQNLLCFCQPKFTLNKNQLTVIILLIINVNICWFLM